VRSVVDRYFCWLTLFLIVVLVSLDTFATEPPEIPTFNVRC
jgi:hypothetical protein